MMIPAAEVSAGAIPASPNGSGMDPLPSQNLFEHFASQSSTAAQTTTPAELGSDILNALENPIEQAQSFSAQMHDQQTATVSEGTTSSDEAGLGDMQFDRMLDSLSAMFDHATLMKLMSSCASQTSGAARTLLRGQ